jgi:hypothetical protein
MFLVGTARCAVRARKPGATNVIGRPIAKVPRALRAVTAQRAVPTNTPIENNGEMHQPGTGPVLKIVNDGSRGYASHLC